MKKKSFTIFAFLVFMISNAQTTIYTNDMDYVVGDVKQAFIQDKITTEAQADYLILGMKNLGVNGIRVPIFADGFLPNKPIFDYFFTHAIAAGFSVFANPAQSGGAARIACGMLNGTVCTVKNDATKTTALIDRIKAFAAEYPCKWIDPFNEDGAPDSPWTVAQMNTIYSTLKNNLNGAELIGPCAWGIPASTTVLNSTNVMNYITVAATHNLGYDHTSWPAFIALAKTKNLPVWDSEVNNNISESTNRGTRLEIAIAAGVDGLVMYDIWSTINLTNGSISNSGKLLMSYYLKNSPSLTSTYQIDGGLWLENTTPLVSQGSTLKLAPLPNDGSWTWTGPNGFSASTREITLNTVSANDVGNYVASYVSPAGYVNNLIISVGLSCSTPSVVVPYYQINGGSWTTNASVNCDEGSKLILGPNSSATGSWSWSGPNGFSSTARQITISSDISKKEEGIYQATLIDGSGCGTIQNYTITVNDVPNNGLAVPFPDPDARYYIDCPELNLRLGADGQNAFTTSTTSTGFNVEWTVKPGTTSGYYYLNCIGSVAKPRIRTDRSVTPNMTTSGSTGTQAMWALTPSIDNTFYLNTSLDITAYPRLQIKANGAPAMIDNSSVDGSVRFTFTDTRKGIVSATVLSVEDKTTSPIELLFPGLLKTSGSKFKPLNSIEGISNYHLEIYSITGQKMYTSKIIDEGWLPKNNANGIYIYKVSYVLNNKLIKKSGKVYCNHSQF